MTTKPAAQILLERYWEDCSNQGNVELVRELCADPIIRHDPGGETELSHQDQIDRLKLGKEMGIRIDRVITHANDEWVTSVWNMESEKGVDGMTMCGIEVFKVEDGVLAHCWNTPYAEGHWSPHPG
ncbi:MAG: nuclear transport factor 2 family protein [Acidimicrobiales bacterium]|nr:nuclear transport factor 2 family protein [Acidimicrobiales bacterium]